MEDGPARFEKPSILDDQGRQLARRAQTSSREVYTSRRADLVAAGLLLIGAAGIKALLTAPGSLM